MGGNHILGLSLARSGAVPARSPIMAEWDPLPMQAALRQGLGGRWPFAPSSAATRPTAARQTSAVVRGLGRRPRANASSPAVATETHAATSVPPLAASGAT